jgi:hypothetical protein
MKSRAIFPARSSLVAWVLCQNLASADQPKRAPRNRKNRGQLPRVFSWPAWHLYSEGSLEASFVRFGTLWGCRGAQVCGHFTILEQPDAPKAAGGRSSEVSRRVGESQLPTLVIACFACHCTLRLSSYLCYACHCMLLFSLYATLVNACYSRHRMLLLSSYATLVIACHSCHCMLLLSLYATLGIVCHACHCMRLLSLHATQPSSAL